MHGITMILAAWAAIQVQEPAPHGLKLPELYTKGIERSLSQAAVGYDLELPKVSGDLYVLALVPRLRTPEAQKEGRIVLSITYWRSDAEAAASLQRKLTDLSASLHRDAVSVADESYRYCNDNFCTIYCRSGSLEVFASGPATDAERFLVSLVKASGKLQNELASRP